MKKPGESASKLFAKIPPWWDETGIVRRLDATQLRVALCLGRHADENWVAEPGCDTIAAFAGVSPRQVIRVTDWFHESGLITKIVGGGRHNTNRYTFARNPDVQGVTVSDSRKGDKSGNPKPFTLTFRVRNPDTHGCRTNKEQTGTGRTEELDTKENATKFLQQIGEALQLTDADLRQQAAAVRAAFRRACETPEPIPVLRSLVQAASEIGDSNGHIRNPAAAWQSRANAILKEPTR